MSAFGDHELHQSLAAAGLAGGWELAAGHALSLRPRTAAVLRIRAGRAWATLGERPRSLAPQEAGDHFLRAGEQLWVPAGRHLVLESLDPGALSFEWQPVRARDTLRQSLRDLVAAAALAGTALLRLVRGLAAYPQGLLLAGCRGLRRR